MRVIEIDENANPINNLTRANTVGSRVLKSHDNKIIDADGMQAAHLRHVKQVRAAVIRRQDPIVEVL